MAWLLAPFAFHLKVAQEEEGMRTSCHYMPLLLAIGFMGALLITPTVIADPVAVSTFDTDDEGWLIRTTQGYVGAPMYSSTGGNPDGLIYATDPDNGAWGFSAPDKFLHYVLDAYGQALTFDIAAYNMPDPNMAGWVGIEGAGHQFVCTFDAPATTYPAWHSHTLWMTETAGWFDPDTLQPPTHTQMIAVLTALDGLVISAEFREGLEGDTSGLDNVVLMPEPGTLGMLALGVAALVWRRRR